MKNTARKAREKSILRNRDVLEKYKPKELRKKQKNFIKAWAHIWDRRMTPSILGQSRTRSHLILTFPGPPPVAQRSDQNEPIPLAFLHCPTLSHRPLGICSLFFPLSYLALNPSGEFSISVIVLFSSRTSYLFIDISVLSIHLFPDVLHLFL